MEGLYGLRLRCCQHENRGISRLPVPLGHLSSLKRTGLRSSACPPASRRTRATFLAPFLPVLGSAGEPVQASRSSRAVAGLPRRLTGRKRPPRHRAAARIVATGMAADRRLAHRCDRSGARPRVQGTATWITAGARAHRSRREPEPIELGNEPPLSVDGGTASDRPPPRLGAVVFRHDPDRLLRRCSHGRRRFCVARRRGQFRLVPERVESALRGAFGAGDRLPARARPTGCRPSAKPMSRAKSSASPP